MHSPVGELLAPERLVARPNHSRIVAEEYTHFILFISSEDAITRLMRVYGMTREAVRQALYRNGINP